jgi:hypothetical protein
MMYQQWIRLMLLSTFLAGCGGGSDTPTDNASNNSSGTPVAVT